MRYQSVIGFGTAAFLERPEDKINALNIIMGQYSRRSYEFPEKILKATAVIKITIEGITGKQSGV